MESAPLEFFKRLLDTPSPSGYEKPVQDLVRDYLKPIAESVDTDLHGNVIGAKNTGAPLRVMYAGHCDQIGMLVTQIDELGFIYAQTIGGWDPQQLIGQRMMIWTSTGPVPAVIARKPIHLLNDEERKTVVAAKDLWLDIGAKDQEEAKSLVRIGDPVTLKLGFQEMRNGLANAPKMDNTTGLWVVLEALRRAGKLNCSLFSVSTVQEEIGLRGAKTSAHGINPHVGIGVDVTHATDCPTIDKRQQGEVTLGNGPVIYRGPNMNPKVVERLILAADEFKIPYQLAALGKPASNDSNALQMAQAGVAAGCVAIPNRYMHSAVEVVSLEDIDNAATLLARFAEMIEADADFRP
ncbi:M42 family metallopeptidase [Blastopirellula marina]|uniref:Probable endoglucanase n=1 Tax=Blastopirellula marina DSM 3645 TaxID=314230 RepID=A4A2P0_9BACT|nr:M42 family metallopeptidase [Blastopirellula marina]EAQ76960.1 probable endoglucanase [Blastopirellula marina DSM 3645]